jgi:hypothetical protein
MRQALRNRGAYKVSDLRKWNLILNGSCRSFLALFPGLFIVGCYQLLMDKSPSVVHQKRHSSSKTSSVQAKGPLIRTQSPVPAVKKAPDGILKISFQDLQFKGPLQVGLNSKDLLKVLPNESQNWRGQRIRILGFMDPMTAFYATGISQFVLVRDTSWVSFEAAARRSLDQKVAVTLKSGTTTDYIDRDVVVVEGVFRIDPQIQGDSGQVQTLYGLDDARIVPRK